MAIVNVNGTNLYYEEMGTGQPIIFIHGLWMSCRFFHKQFPYFSKKYRAIALDLRGHGRSTKIPVGHTVANYARDVRMFITELELKQAVLVGWSMGCLVAFDYFRQFGYADIKAMVDVDQPASDLNTQNWNLGIFDFKHLCDAMMAVQENRDTFVRDFLPLMFHGSPTEEDTLWMFDEVTRIPESIACTILFNQTVQDYQSTLAKINIPVLLCFGADEKLYKVAGGEHLRQHLPVSKLVVFERSGHCPFLEEPDRFNMEVDKFIQSLDI